VLDRVGGGACVGGVKATGGGGVLSGAGGYVGVGVGAGAVVGGGAALVLGAIGGVVGEGVGGVAGGQGVLCRLWGWGGGGGLGVWDGWVGGWGSFWCGCFLLVGGGGYVGFLGFFV